MSTEYKINIHRKSDNKLIGCTMANQLKTIFDSELSDVLGCSGRYNANKLRFEVSDLMTVAAKVFSRIQADYAKINEKKLMIALAKNKEIKDELELDIRDIQEYIDDELKYVLYSAKVLQGMISCIVEDQINLSTDKCAYEYNAEDLSKNENGCKTTIWENDVYCEVIAC